MMFLLLCFLSLMMMIVVWSSAVRHRTWRKRNRQVWCRHVASDDDYSSIFWYMRVADDKSKRRHVSLQLDSTTRVVTGRRIVGGKKKYPSLTSSSSVSQDLSHPETLNAKSDVHKSFRSLAVLGRGANLLVERELQFCEV